MAAASPACVVFGGSGAVGREVCRALAARGARVGFTFLNHEATGVEGLAKRLDVTDVPAIERTLDAFHQELGRIDAFVNCAAVGTTVPHAGATVHHVMADADERAWDAMIDINAKSAFFAVRRLGALMQADGGIVLLGSIDGGSRRPPVHYARPSGAERMAKAMAKELGPQHPCQHIAPGVLDGGCRASSRRSARGARNTAA